VAFLEWLQTTGYSEWVQVSWGWAWALTLHAFGNATVVGLMWIIALRLWGFFRSVPYTSLRKLFPYFWIGFAVQVYSGVTLWMAKPPKYVKDWVFDTKFTLVVLGAITSYIFMKTLLAEDAQWQANGAVSKKGIKWVTIAAINVAFITIMGRLTAYLGQLYGGG
jgi:hypothetical protein